LETLRELDHPRTRGDHAKLLGNGIYGKGSPPHTRGPYVKTGTQNAIYGLTPAHAGTIFPLCCRLCRSWDHPRTRGDHKSQIKNSRFLIGSPPHTRGPLRQGYYGGRTERITPAHAGTITIYLFYFCPTQDHPRTRGDHGSRRALCGYFQGSPPHTRGPYFGHVVGRKLVRITPAHAGTIG